MTTTVARTKHAPAPQLVPVAELHPWDANPRTITPARLANLRRALEADPDFLWHRPILARQGDGTIYCGNQRYLAAVANGATAVPTILEDVDERTMRERAIRDNEQWGEWSDGLALVVDSLRRDGSDISLLGLGDDHIERLLAAVLQSEAGEPEDLDLTPPEIATTQVGQLYRLGPHRLICGDSRDPEVWARLFDAFLFQTFGGDTELIRYVQKAAGYSLCGDTREEALFIAHGPTGGGKTTVAEALRAALGDYAATADPETFLTSRRDGASPRADIARLHGRRLVVGVEVDQDRRMAEGLVKQLTGGDTVVARHLYREHFEFRPQFKLWIFANDAPRVRDDDDAVWRRLRLVPFVHPVPREQRDPQLKIALRDPKLGGPAVLAWAVAGCVLWQREGLGTPPVIESATQSYREAQDPVADFVVECCVVEDGAWATTEELYAAYSAWAKAAGERKPLTKRGFGQRLERRGFTAAKAAKGVRIRRGIGLREQQQLGMPAAANANGDPSEDEMELPT